MQRIYSISTATPKPLLKTTHVMPCRLLCVHLFRNFISTCERDRIVKDSNQQSFSTQLTKFKLIMLSFGICVPIIFDLMTLVCSDKTNQDEMLLILINEINSIYYSAHCEREREIFVIIITDICCLGTLKTFLLLSND